MSMFVLIEANMSHMSHVHLAVLGNLGPGDHTIFLQLRTPKKRAPSNFAFQAC